MLAAKQTNKKLQLPNTLITLDYITLQLQLPLHCTVQYCAITTTTLHYTTLQHTTLQDTTIHYKLITPHHKYNCNYTNLHYITTTTYNYNATTATTTPTTTPHYIQQLWWGDNCNHCNHSRKYNSNHLSVHQWIRSAVRESQQATLPIGFLFSAFAAASAAALFSSLASLKCELEGWHKKCHCYLGSMLV